MVKKCDVLIIGSGPAGLMCAISIGKRRNVTLVEKPMKEFKLAKRILVSGNGRANFFNEQLLSSIGEDYDFLIKDSSNHYGKELLKDLEKRGFAYTKEGDLYYPYFKRSECLHTFLLDEMKGINFLAAKAIRIDPEKNLITLLEDGQKVQYQYHDLVLACGGRSYDRNDFDYELLNSLSVSYRPYQPMLCPVRVKEKIPSFLEKNRLACLLRVYSNSKLIYEEKGEILFKKDGLSGICVFNATLAILKTLSKEKNALIEFEVDYLSEKYHSCSLSCYPSFLKDYLRFASLEPGIPLRFTFDSCYDFKESQASYGGICLSEINKEDFSLTKHSHIYTIGEMIDVNLPCGGYNIGTALIEGLRVGNRLGDKHDL